MKLQIRLFAAAKQLAGRDTLEVTLPAGSTLADLRRELAQNQPSLSTLLPRVVFAIAAEYASDETPLAEADEIACIPPVSGG